VWAGGRGPVAHAGASWSRAEVSRAYKAVEQLYQIDVRSRPAGRWGFCRSGDWRSGIARAAEHRFSTAPQRSYNARYTEKRARRSPDVYPIGRVILSSLKGRLRFGNCRYIPTRAPNVAEQL